MDAPTNRVEPLIAQYRVLHRRTRIYRTLTGEKWLPVRARRNVKGLGDLSARVEEISFFDEPYSEFTEDDEERLFALIDLCRRGADPKQLLSRLKVLGKARQMSSKLVIDEALQELTSYLRRSTGQWQDKKLAVLLQGDYSEDALRMRRQRIQQRRQMLDSIGVGNSAKAKRKGAP